jgi:apolipoprotein N-acyltransferase
VVHMGSESSFGSPLACAQSLHLAQFRAIELRRPVVRADNSGVSGWIDPTGRLHQATSTFQAQSVMLEVSLDPHPTSTWFTFWGDYPVYILSLIGLALGYWPRRTASQH